jgi:anti-sigma factor RsiW
MMDHPGEGQLQAYLDGETTPEATEALEGHLRGCPDCRARLEELEALAQEVSRRLAVLEPETDVEAALWRLRQARARKRVGLHRSRTAAAAVVILLLGAGAAMALPGSPVRGWLAGEEEVVTVEAPTSEAVDTEGAALTVALQDGRAQVELNQLHPEAAVAFRLTSGPAVQVQTPRGAALETGTGWVRIQGGEAGRLRLELPREARTVEIRVDGAPRAVLQEGTLEIDGIPVESGDDPDGWIELPREAE